MSRQFSAAFSFTLDFFPLRANSYETRKVRTLEFKQSAMVRAGFFSHLRKFLSKFSVENELHFRPNIPAICLFAAVTDHRFLSALATILSTKPSSHLLAHLPKFHSSHNGFLHHRYEISQYLHDSNAKLEVLMFTH